MGRAGCHQRNEAEVAVIYAHRDGPATDHLSVTRWGPTGRASSCLVGSPLPLRFPLAVPAQQPPEVPGRAC